MNPSHSYIRTSLLRMYKTTKYDSRGAVVKWARSCHLIPIDCPHGRGQGSDVGRLFPHRHDQRCLRKRLMMILLGLVEILQTGRDLVEVRASFYMISTGGYPPNRCGTKMLYITSRHARATACNGSNVVFYNRAQSVHVYRPKRSRHIWGLSFIFTFLPICRRIKKKKATRTSSSTST